jgi:hypothetical protein
MALKRTKVLGWTKHMSATQKLVSTLNRRGNFEQASKLNEANRNNHQQRVGVILRRHKHRGV